MLFAGENLHTPRPLSRLVEINRYISPNTTHVTSTAANTAQVISAAAGCIGAGWLLHLPAWTLRMGTVKPQVQPCRSDLQSGLREAPTEYCATRWGLKQKACGVSSHRLKQLQGTKESTTNQQNHRHIEQADPSEEG